MAEPVTRRSLGRWLGWFGLANAVVLGLVSLNYLDGGGWPTSALSLLYLVTIYTSHHALLALLPLTLLLGPLVILWPRKPLVFALAVIWLAALIAFLVLDSLVWSQGRFHVNQLTAQILGWQSWLFVAVMFCIALVFESLLAQRAWRWVQAKPRRHGGKLALLLVLSLLVAQGIHAWADASYYTPVTSVAQRLPVHSGITAKKFLVRNGLVDISQARERQLASRLARGETPPQALDYPLQPLQCAQQPPLNLLLILLDAWRFDMFNAQLTPRIHTWAQANAVQFSRHSSGGNSSRLGVFSFFYGLPPGYFSSFEAVQQPALLVDTAQRQGYRMGLFSGAEMYRPVTLDRTAFASVPNLRVTPENPSAPSWQRDQQIVDLWSGFLDAQQDAQPFFGFLFFDSSNTHSAPPGYAAGVPMATGLDSRMAEYQASIHYLDTLVAGVLADLEARGLADSTVVMVSADHGEEFGESGAEFQIHGSGYSRYQLQVPMLLSIPGMAAGEVATRTSHYDVAPTLLGRVFGCSNDAADYSSGADLFTRRDWDWLVAGSYYNYAVLEPDRIIVTFPNGLFEVRDADYRLLEQPQIDADVLQEVMRENRRFYR
jgi:membrane-anchored protein YejM (alkaline phosphatase superfamily)